MEKEILKTVFKEMLNNLVEVDKVFKIAKRISEKLGLSQVEMEEILREVVFDDVD